MQSIQEDSSSFCTNMVPKEHLTVSEDDRTTATLSASVSDLDDSNSSPANSKKMNIRQAVCDNEDERIPVAKKAMSKWEKRYRDLLADYEDQQDELDEVKDILDETESSLYREECQVRKLEAENHGMQQELLEVINDREQLYEECVNMKTLLAAKNSEIDTLSAQVKLLIQVGTIKRSSGSTDSFGRSSGSSEFSIRSSGSSEVMDPREESPQGNPIDKGVMRSISSLFLPKQKTSMNEWKNTKECKQMIQASLRDEKSITPAWKSWTDR